MASGYIEHFEDSAKDKGKTVEVYILIPGITVKPHAPVIGTAKLEDNCNVDVKFDKNSSSVEMIAIIKKKDGTEVKYRYALPKLPGDIEVCTPKFSNGMVTLIFEKAKPYESWEVQIAKGLRTLKA